MARVLLVIGLVIGAGIVALVAMRRSARRIRRSASTRYRTRALDSEFELPRDEGVQVGRMSMHWASDALSLRISGTKTVERIVPLSELPLTLARHRLQHLGEQRFSVHEQSCNDNDFLTDPDQCTPLVPSEFRGIRLAGPRRIAYLEGASRVERRPGRKPVPVLNIAGTYRIDSEVLGRDITERDVFLAITNTATGNTHRVSLETARRDYMYFVQGISSVPATVEPTVEPAEPSSRAGLDTDRERRATGGSFVLDIGMYIEPLDELAVYEVAACCGDESSETLHIRIEP